MSEGHLEPEAPRPIEGRATYVACLDVLGFRGHLARTDARLLQAYRSFLQVGRASGGMRLQVQVGDASTGYDLRDMTLGFSKLRGPVVFSDSVFLLTEDDSRASLDELCLYSNSLFRNAFRSNLLLRGAIASGVTWHYPKERVTIGHGIVQAFDLEQSLDVIGIVLHPDVPDSPAAGPPMEVPTKAGMQQLRPVLGQMPSHPSYLPLSVRQHDWEARFQMLRKAAPSDAQSKYWEPLVRAMFDHGAP